jgi:DNA-binding CsgD family transcriptional regulator
MRWCEAGIWCTFEVLDYDAYRRLSSRLVELCRTRGTLGTLPVALDYLGTAYIFAGHLKEAEELNAEGRGILAATGTPDRLGVTSTELLLPAWRGQEEKLRAAAAEMARDCARRGQHRGAVYPHFALTVFAIATRDYGAALQHARVHLEENGSYLGSIILPYAVEAGVHCGDRATAELALDRLVVRARVGGTEWGLGLSAQCRAIALRGTGPDSDTEREKLFTEAIGHLERAGALFDLARTRLLFGEWLRRKHRREQAAEQLREAWESFEAIGAAAFAERARTEQAVGTRERAGDTAVPSGVDDLTEREAQIARLVGGGATNAQVATRLFISPSTVDHHLRNIYRKLGVSSRTMLAAVLRDWL